MRRCVSVVAIVLMLTTMIPVLAQDSTALYQKGYQDGKAVGSRYSQSDWFFTAFQTTSCLTLTAGYVDVWYMDEIMCESGLPVRGSVTGCLSGLLMEGISGTARISVTDIPDGSPEYRTGYVAGYRQAIRGRRMGRALMGSACGFGIGLSITLALFLASAVALSS